MTAQPTTSPQLDQIVSTLNHRVTGSLARLEGLYRLYQQEGCLRDELWEQAFGDAKTQLHDLLTQSFDLCARPTYELRSELSVTKHTAIEQAA